MILLLVACASDTKIDRVNDAPTASIEAPLEGELFRQGAGLVGLRGTVADTYDDPPALTVSWVVDDGASVPVTADADGLVSLDLDASTLALGEHEARLDVVDTDGDGGTVSVRFEIGGPLGPPLVEITDPDDGLTVVVGTAITFVGAASDTTTPAEGLTFTWSSDLDGELPGAITGGGQSALLTSWLSVGAHVITLSVGDGDGEVGSDSIGVVIEDIPEDPPEPEPGDLIFSEVMVNPNAAADEDGEWVELYNTSGYTIDITGYSFHDDGADYWVFDAPIQVDPHGFIVLCANPNPAVNGGVTCDGWFYRNPMGEMPSEGQGHGSGVAIANNDDELVLTSPAGVDIDVFDYDDTDSDPIETGMGFGLDPTRMDGVSNDDVGNWCVQTTVLAEGMDPGTPGQANDACVKKGR